MRIPLLVGVALSAALALEAPPVPTPVPAGAATVAVTTTDDGVPGSLREAISTANAGSIRTEIVLTTGQTYDLTVCGDDDDNQVGDLDLEPAKVTVRGNGATVRNTCDGERVLDVQDCPLARCGPDATTYLHDLVVRGGDSDGEGGGIRARSDVHLEGVTLGANRAQQGGGGIYASDDASVTILSSLIADNATARDGAGLRLDGSLLMEDTTVIGNESSNLNAEGGGMMLDAGAPTSLVIRRSTIQSNVGGFGGGIYLNDEVLTIEDTRIERNLARDGGGVYHYGEVRIAGSTLDGNRAMEEGGAVFSVDRLEAENTTISGNESGTHGGGIFSAGAPLELRYVTVVGNRPQIDGAPVPHRDGSGETSHSGANLHFRNAAQADLFATLITGDGSGPDCVLAQGVLSWTSRYSYGTDGTCPLNDPTDTPSGSAPLIGALTDNGGPTPTHLPLTDSPLLDVVPAATTECGGSDQRGVARPSGTGCDVGAVEREQGFAPTTTTVRPTTTTVPSPTSSAPPSTALAPTAPPATPILSSPQFTG